MENPATWGEAERVVHEVLIQRSTGEIRMGLSKERRIVNALRARGLLVDPEPPSLLQWAHSLDTLALKKMAEGMPYRSESRKNEIIAWLLEHRHEELEESYRISHPEQVKD